MMAHPSWAAPISLAPQTDAAKNSNGPTVSETSTVSALASVESVQASPQSAGEAYRLWGRAVWRILYYRGLDSGQLEDATQEVFLTAHHRWSSIHDESKRRMWLFGIAQNVARQFHRGARKSARTPATDFSGENEPADATPSATPESVATAKFLDGLLARLPEEQRLAVVLCRVEGWTAREAGEAMQISQRAVNSRLETAEKQLRSWVNQYRGGNR